MQLVTDYLRLRGIRKHFGAFRRCTTSTWRSRSGEFVCFLGPSGCGKTTLLRIIAGLETQTAGTHPAGRPRHLAAAAGERDYGIVFQSYALFPNLTVADNVAYGLVNRQDAAGEIARARRRAAEAGRPAGQRARSIRRSSRAASSSASRWRARSPRRRDCCCSTSRCRRSTRSSACGCAARSARCSSRLGVTTIMVTHDQEEALSMADRIVVMNQGVIEQVGTPLRGLPRAGDRRSSPTSSARSTCSPAACAPGRRLRIGGMRASPASSDADRRSARQASTCAPRTCCAADRDGRRRTSFDGAIDKIEFLGALLPGPRPRRRASPTQPLTVYLSLNYMPSRCARGRRRAARCAAARAHAALLSRTEPVA